MWLRLGKQAALRYRGQIVWPLGVLVALVGVVAIARWAAGDAVEAGIRLIARGDSTRAVRVLVRSVATRPADARAHYVLGLAYTNLGAHTAAVRRLRTAVRLAPRRAEFHDALGRAYWVTGDRPAARRELEEAIRLDPSEVRHRIALAGLLLDQDQEAAAIEHLRQAARLRPNADGIHLLLATLLRRAADATGAEREYAALRRPALDGPRMESMATLP